MCTSGIQVEVNGTEFLGMAAKGVHAWTDVPPPTPPSEDFPTEGLLDWTTSDTVGLAGEVGFLRVSRRVSHASRRVLRIDWFVLNDNRRGAVAGKFDFGFRP
eukprot:3795188-Pyramimonas_sp.AAC.1